MKKILVIILGIVAVSVASPAFAAKRSIMELPLFERAVLIIKKFETMHNPKNWPCVGYGHQVQPGEPYRRMASLLRLNSMHFSEKTSQNSYLFIKTMAKTLFFSARSPITEDRVL